MTATTIDFLFPTQTSIHKNSSPSEKEKTRQKINQDPRMIEFVKRLVAMQANGNPSLSSGKFETEEEYNLRREEILHNKY